MQSLHSFQALELHGIPDQLIQFVCQEIHDVLVGNSTSKLGSSFFLDRTEHLLVQSR